MVPVMDSEHGCRINFKNSRGIVAPAKRLKSLSSDSSSLSDNSSGDFIQVDPILKNPRVPATASPNDVGHLCSYYTIDVSSEISSKSGHDSEWSTGGTSSQVSDLTNETLSHRTSLTESPPTQVMERPHGFDPHRISPSIFASKSHAPMDWSVASNESLFSIRLGNSSFSRDTGDKLSGELLKSGELQKTMNLPEFGESHKASGFTPPPTIRGKESERKYVNMGRNFGEIEAAPEDKKIKDVPIEIAIDHSEELLPVLELSFNNCSDGITTTTDTQTFASRRKKKHARSSWYCSNCSCGFCCPTRPSCCSCKWPSCNCYKWPSCSSCKLTSCSYCCKWPSCSCFKWSSCCKLPSSNCMTCTTCISGKPSSSSCCSWPCFSCCNWPNCSGCSWPSCSSCCNWPSCSHCCKWPSCSGGCKWPSCSGCKWPSCISCCKWPNCSGCCKWPSFSSCCKWPSSSWCCKVPSCSSCNWAFCCWKSRQKRTSFTEGTHMHRHSEQKKWYSCFFCCSNPC